MLCKAGFEQCHPHFMLINNYRKETRLDDHLLLFYGHDNNIIRF